jgi:hypothetical protein
VRVDKKLKNDFNQASKAFSGSTCSAIEYIMAAYVGVAKTHQINGVYPTLTVNPIEIGEIKIERNLRERRKDVVARTPGELAVETETRCMIGSCDKLAVEVATYHPKGAEAKEYQVCTFHASSFAGSNVWSVRKC